MPAKKEYLSGPGQRALKISAGILGGYMLTVAFHLSLGALFKDKMAIMLTASFSLFIIWTGLIVTAFLFRNGWQAWAVYVICTLIFASIYFISR